MESKGKLVLDEQGFTRWQGVYPEKHLVIWYWDGAAHLRHQKTIYGTRSEAEQFAREMKEAGALSVEVKS